MSQSRFKDYYLPPRVIAFTIAVIVIGLAGLLSYVYVFGFVRVSTSVAGAYATLTSDPLERALPHTYKLRPRRYTITVGANGYLDKELKVAVYPFMTQNKSVDLDRDYSYVSERFTIVYDYERATYVVSPQLNLNVFSPPEVQLAAQWSDYEAKAKEAIEYLKKQGASASSLPIVWGLQEWWPDGRSLDHVRSR